MMPRTAEGLVLYTLTFPFFALALVAITLAAIVLGAWESLRD
jgi:hypothetical protein